MACREVERVELDAQPARALGPTTLRRNSHPPDHTDSVGDQALAEADRLLIGITHQQPHLRAAALAEQLLYVLDQRAPEAAAAMARRHREVVHPAAVASVAGHHRAHRAVDYA